MEEAWWKNFFRFAEGGNTYIYRTEAEDVAVFFSALHKITECLRYTFLLKLQ